MDKNVLNRLTEDWRDLKEIVIYGFGRVALRSIKKLKQDFRIKYVIDNKPDMQLIGKYLEWEIKNFQQVKDYIKSSKVIVATASSAYESIREDLLSVGMQEYKDFCKLEDFFTEWYWKYRGEVCISQVTSSLTSKCTFKCRNCGSLMPYFKEHYNYLPDDILVDLNLFFNRVDYLASYYLVGGEPFLNKNLGTIIQAIYDNYSDKIGCIQIVSNGSVVPDKITLNILRECKVNVRLSDYTDEISYAEKFEAVKIAFQQAGVDYTICKFEKWLDLGFPDSVHYKWKNPKEIKEHMLHCSTGCHALNDRKFYYCGTLFFAEKSKLFKLEDDDYIDLDKKSLDLLEDKIAFSRYCLGDIEKDYISLCKICRGYGLDNEHLVKAAEQGE